MPISTTECRIDHKQPDRVYAARRGIALIIVLGILSAMLLLAVAFSITMRTERLAAATGVELVRAEQLARSAIVAAMDDLNYYLTNHPAVGFSTHPLKSEAIFVSVTNGSAGGNTDVDLVSGAATNWLPRRYLNGADPDFDAYAADDGKQWIHVTDPATGRLLGRYAYLVFDCNGMLDANLAGDNPQRGFGLSVSGEVDYRWLPEVGTEARRNSLVANRSFYYRFISLPEVIFLNDGDDNYPTRDEEQAVTPGLVDNLVPYSLAYDSGYWDGSQFVGADPNGTIELPGGNTVPVDPTAWDWNQSQRAFEAAGYSGDTSAVLASMWQDYLDSDFLPGGSAGEPDPDYVSCEPIPMINEIALNYQVRQPGGATQEVQYIHDVVVELWYPFPANTNNEQYSVTVNAPAGAFDILAVYSSDTGNGQATFTYETGTKSCVPSPVSPGQGNKFIVVTARFVHVYSPEVEINQLMARTRQVRGLTVEVFTGGQVVDRAAPDGFLSCPPVRIDGGGDSGLLEAGISWQVNDPRGNHNSGAWQTQTPTRGEQNSTIANFNIAANGDVEGTNMYVRNSTNVMNVGEFGFLPTGEPWTTVDLFSEEGKNLLNWFRIGGYRGVTNGLINPNTYSTNVLYAAFRDVPIDEWPQEPHARLSDPNSVWRLANSIVSVAATGTFNGRADWVLAPALEPGGVFTMDGYNNCQKEAIIRNSIGLFNVGQNLYTVLVVAQAIKDRGTLGRWDEDTDTVTAEKKAAALVWRNPFPCAVAGEQHHETFIRFFKFLSD